MKKRVFLTSIITICVLVISCGLLALPGQFATIKNIPLSGYEFIFFYKDVDGINYLAKNVTDARASAAGIIGLLFILFALVCLVFNKKSSLLALMGGVFTALSGLMFILMNLWAVSIYHKTPVELSWVTYVIGGLFIVLGALLIFVGVKALKEENLLLNAPKSKQYSYINSNKKN